ncbi:hypothetical protein KKI24_19675 [bacterium]|nr:hypothetical protein [bacterium]
MAASISIIAENKAAISKIKVLLENQGHRTTCFTGKNEPAEFLKDPPQQINLLILDVSLIQIDDFLFLEEIVKTGLTDTTPILFLGSTHEQPQIPHLKPGWFDFIDPESDLQQLESRVAVLLEIQKLQAQLNATTPGEGEKLQNSFLGSMSHDLRNPIHSILSYAKFGLEKSKNGALTDEKSQHYYQSIRNAGNRLLSLLNDILELTNLDDNRIPFNICERNLESVAQVVLQEFSRETDSDHLLLCTDEPNDAYRTHFDAKQIGQVIRRFIAGALNIAKTNARITLKIETTDPSSAGQSLAEQRAIRFTLHHPEADFSEERLDSLQRLLKTGRDTENAFGQIELNLSICQRIIAKHDGRIWIENHPDTGMIIGFLLPVDP